MARRMTVYSGGRSRRVSSPKTKARARRGGRSGALASSWLYGFKRIWKHSGKKGRWLN